MEPVQIFPYCLTVVGTCVSSRYTVSLKMVHTGPCRHHRSPASAVKVTYGKELQDGRPGMSHCWMSHHSLHSFKGSLPAHMQRFAFHWNTSSANSKDCSEVEVASHVRQTSEP